MREATQSFPEGSGVVHFISGQLRTGQTLRAEMKCTTPDPVSKHGSGRARLGGPTTLPLMEAGELRRQARGYETREVLGLPGGAGAALAWGVDPPAALETPAARHGFGGVGWGWGAWPQRGVGRQNGDKFGLGGLGGDRCGMRWLNSHGYSGITPCLRLGSSSRLVLMAAKPAITLRRVSAGSMTSST